ncbi:hypothetical protein [Flavobacterium sp.]|uniref:hypothetical protein n=1 Tax=Flavobacterium sp. TaxID=239 RepID=UPI00262D6B39|nr:hypothetical protein [Flavobacterium sp.]
MIYDMIWDVKAQITFEEEINYILFKWNFNEVKKFSDLVEENLSRLSINPEIGIYSKSLKVYCIVISKQTTLYYSFNSDMKIIELHFFFNNQKNPEELNKLL